MNRTMKYLMIALRLAIGWHFLYEGVFKLGLDDAWQQPSTARCFVYSSVERLHRDAAGLTQDQGRERMRQWADEVARHFQRRGTPLGDEQKVKLAMLRQAREPKTLEWSYVHDEVLGLAARGGAGGFTAEPFLRSSWGPFRPVYRAMIADADGMGRLRPESVARSLDARYSKLVAHYRLDDAQRRQLAAIRDGLKQDSAAILGELAMQARLADYRVMLATVREAGRGAFLPFGRERQQALRKRADDTGAELLSYATEPAEELTSQAVRLATVEQLKAGPLRVDESPARWLNVLIPWLLVAIGLCLMVGLGTLPAAVAGAMLLATFYFAMPPWPGLPAPPGESHFLFVDRNVIEMLALLVVAKGGQR